MADKDYEIFDDESDQIKSCKDDACSCGCTGDCGDDCKCKNSSEDSEITESDDLTSEEAADLCDNISVEKPDFEKTDMSDEEIIKNIVKTNKGKPIDVNDEKIKREIFDKKMKTKYEDIDWSKIEFEDIPEYILDGEHLLPKLTDEDVNVFEAITQGFIDSATIKTWVDISKSNIKEYCDEINFYRLKENEGPISEEDKTYIESLKETMLQSKSMIASIQQESRSMAKDFEKDKILDDTIKNVTYNIIMNFISSKFRYRDVEIINSDSSQVQIQLEKKDRHDLIIKDLTSYLSINTLFNEYYNYSKIRSEKNILNNRFYTKKILSNNKTIAYTINEFVKLHKSINDKNIDIQSIMRNDICFLNYIVPSITCAVLKYGDGTLLKEPTNKDAYERYLKEATFNNRMPEGCLSSLYSDITRLIVKLNNIDVINSMLEFAKSAINDKNFNNINTEILNNSGLTFTDDNFEKILMYKVKTTPPITDCDINVWLTHYHYILCLDRIIDLINVKKILSDETKDDTAKSVATFNLLLRLFEHDYRSTFSNIINDIKRHIYSELSGQYRDLLFRSVIDNLMFQHVVGYKTYDIPGDRESFTSDKMYEYLKVKEPIFYKTCIINPETDFVLKDINIFDVRNRYFEVLLYSIIPSFEYDLDILCKTTSSTFTHKEHNEKLALSKVNKGNAGKKVSRRRRKHSR